MFYNMKLKFLNKKKLTKSKITPGSKLYLNEYDILDQVGKNHPFYYSSEHLLPAMYDPIYEESVMDITPYSIFNNDFYK